jgi:pyruvyltransferase
MKSISAFWIPSPDMKYTNFGDILTPYILQKYNINCYHKDKDDNPDICGIGSLLHMIPKDFSGYVWSTGMMYPTHRLHFKKTPLAVRGNLSCKQFDNDMSNVAIGDGGLLLEKIYKPKPKRPYKYKLGIFPNYADIVNMRDNPIENFNLIKSNPYDVLLIDPRNYIETVIDYICSCDKIITSSLHGAVVCDSYNIDYAIFSARETQLAIHQLQGSFKFRDYFSAFQMNFNGPDLFLNEHTNYEEVVSKCLPNNKTFTKYLKINLEKSIDRIKDI